MSVEAAERGIRKLIGVSLTRYQFSALVSFLISVGAKEFRKSEVYKLTVKGQFLLAAERFSDYRIGTDGKEDKELMRRREYERRLYTHPVIVTNTGKTGGVE
jgi:GH24 family phage-related lysozyme (muramidase)